MSAGRSSRAVAVLCAGLVWAAAWLLLGGRPGAASQAAPAGTDPAGVYFPVISRPGQGTPIGNPVLPTEPASPTPTATPSATPSTTPTATPTGTPSSTPTSTATPTATPASSGTATEPAPSGPFLGVNGGPIDGGAGTEYYDGNLSHNAPLRANSFYWQVQAGLTWFRNYGSDGIVYAWRFVEPEDDAFDWTAWDLLVELAQAQNIRLLASIGNAVPQWANGSTSFRDPPLDLHAEPMENTAWYDYVYTFVERYDGDGVDDMPGLTGPIKYWEIWNEPDLRQGWLYTPEPPPATPMPHQFNGSVYDYVRLSQVAYAAIKAADPEATVVGPSTAQVIGNTYRGEWFIWNWPDFVSAGGLNYVDVVSFHHYFDGLEEWDALGYMEIVLDLAEDGRGDKPVWITEIGWTGDPYVDYLSKAVNLVRSAVMAWERPWFTKYFWYFFHASETHGGSNQRAFIQTYNGDASRGTDPDPLMHPVHRASETFTRVLAGFDANAHPAALDVGPEARAYVFTGDGVQVWVAWLRATSGTATIELDTGGQTTRMIGLFGEDLGTFDGGELTVGYRPIYLTTNLDWDPDLGRIAGRVRDGSQPNSWNNGLAGLTVSLAGPVNTTATTDSAGYYVFSGLPEGEYTVSVPGYSTTPGSHSVTLTREGAWGRTSFTVNGQGFVHLRPHTSPKRPP